MILSLAPFGVPGQAALLPAVALTCVWFWSLYRPAAMPPPMVAVLVKAAPSGACWENSPERPEVQSSSGDLRLARGD